MDLVRSMKEHYSLGKYKFLNLVGASGMYTKGNGSDVDRVSIKMKRKKCVKTK